MGNLRFELASNARFELVRQIGEGGMGIVYEAHDRETGKNVALKTLRPRDATSLSRFQREFREAQGFHHPNLVALGDLIATETAENGRDAREPQWYFTMELVNGVDFTSYVCASASADHESPAPPMTIRPMSIRSVRAVEPFDEARLRASLIGLGQGLLALHGQGKVHRDIKPSNVLITPLGRVVLLDFGLLSDAQADDPSGAMMGALGYMAPEQAASQTVGPAADLYAVGAMLFEALTGQTPFEGGPIDVLKKKLARAVPPSPRTLRPRVPRDLDALCMELMHPDPAKRPTADRLLARLGVKRGDEAPIDAGKEGDLESRVECIYKEAGRLIARGDIERGVPLIESGLRDLGDALPSSPGRAAASLLWHRARLRLRGVGVRAATTAPIDPLAVVRLEAFHAVASVLGMVDPVCGAAYQARALLLALDLGHVPCVGRALALEATYLASQGGIARARAMAAEAQKVADGANDSYVTAAARAASGIVAYYAGDFRAASVELREAGALLESTPAAAPWERSTVRMFRLGALAALGHFADLDQGVVEALRDAAGKDDRYSENNLTRMFNIVWLAKDEVDDARRVLDTKRWEGRAGAFQVPHFFELIARIDIDLYAGDAAHSRTRYAAELARLDRSLMMRLQTMRVTAHWSLARLALAEGNLSAAASYAKRLHREGLVPALVYASLLEASVVTAERDDAAAMAHLDDAIARSESAELRFLAAVARRRRGELLGGDEGRALKDEADAWIAAQGVRRPDRFAAIVTPAFR